MSCLMLSCACVLHLRTPANNICFNSAVLAHRGRTKKMGEEGTRLSGGRVPPPLLNKATSEPLFPFLFRCHCTIQGNA